MEDDLKKIVQPKTIKSKNNDCGTAPGNLIRRINLTRMYSIAANPQETLNPVIYLIPFCQFQVMQ